jgi:hypothetical protein
VVDAADFDFWRMRFGANSGAGANVSGAAVPEASTTLMLGMAGVFLGICRRDLKTRC